MIAHTGILVSDYQKSKDFYAKLLKTLGYTQNMAYGEAAGYNDGKNTDFWVTRDPEKGMAKMHVAFEAKSKEEVDAFHAKALELGGTDNGAPGYRTDYWPGYYAAFIHDPDGHNIEAVWYDYSKVKEEK